MKEKIDFLLNKRQKIWFKEGASKNFRAVSHVLKYVLALFVMLIIAMMGATQLILAVTPLENQGYLPTIFMKLGGDYRYAVIILLFFTIHLITAILEKRGLLSEENGACLEMIKLVEKSKEARVYRDGVVNMGLPLLKYDLEKVKEIISEIRKKEVEIEQKRTCQKAHGLISD